jgi:8-amino-7-oxononanoate synthase
VALSAAHEPAQVDGFLAALAEVLPGLPADRPAA